MTSTLRRSGKISAKLRATHLVCLASPLLGLIALANPAQAANLVQNGGFESNSGPGYVSGNPITNWTLINTASTGISINAINTLAQLQAAGQTANTPIPLWGASASYMNGNGFRNSNNGGYFIIADGFYEYNSIFAQRINGLTPGTDYELSFEYAYAQQAGFDGPTNQKWTVEFGSENYETPAYDLPSHAFYGGSNSTGWLTASHTFTATAASQTLRFLTIGTPGVPPMALLDGVSLTEVVPTPPEPTPTPTPGPLPLLGLGATVAWSGRLRQRIKRGGLA